MYQQKTLDTVEKMIMHKFNLTEATEYREMVRYCIEQSNLLSVFKAEAKSTLGDIDDIILQAILKSNYASISVDGTSFCEQWVYFYLFHQSPLHN